MELTDAQLYYFQHKWRRSSEGMLRRYYSNTGWIGIARLIIGPACIASLISLATFPKLPMQKVLVCLIIGGSVVGWFAGRAATRLGKSTIAAIIPIGRAIFVGCWLLIPIALPTIRPWLWLTIIGYTSFLLTSYFRLMSDRSILALRPAKLPWYKINRAGYIDPEL